MSGRAGLTRMVPRSSPALPEIRKDKMMKYLVGMIFILGGVCLGLYLGLWLCFIGGIVQLVEACKADPVSAFGIAFGFVRIVIASFVGWFSFIVCSAIGGVIISD